MGQEVVICDIFIVVQIQKKNKSIDLITMNGKPCDYLFYKAWMKTKKDLSSIYEGIKNQIMFARLTSERSILKHRELEQVLLLSTTISSNKVKKKQHWKNFIATTSNKKRTSFHS